MLDERDVTTVVDMEAGLEHLSRGTARHVDSLLVTLEPYFKSLETARRTVEMAREFEIGRIAGVANKLRDSDDAAAVRDFAAAHDIPLAGEVPFDDELRRADLAGLTPLDVRDSPAVAAIDRLASVMERKAGLKS